MTQQFTEYAKKYPVHNAVANGNIELIYRVLGPGPLFTIPVNLESKNSVGRSIKDCFDIRTNRLKRDIRTYQARAAFLETHDAKTIKQNLGLRRYKAQLEEERETLTQHLDYHNTLASMLRTHNPRPLELN